MIQKKFQSGLLAAATPFLLLVSCKSSGQSQKLSSLGGEVITVAETERIEKKLAADEMRGRRTFTADIDKAADFIAAEFSAAGLGTFNNSGSYKQEFAMVRTKHLTSSALLDGTTVDPKEILVVTCQQQLKITGQSGFKKEYIKAGINLQNEARKFIRSGKNLLVLVDRSHANSFGNLVRLRSNLFKTDHSVVFILTDKDPSTFVIESSHEVTEQKLSNVVAVLPGRNRKDELVIFSGHYDHLGVGKTVNSDSIYNGANDDAAGVTGVIMLAKHFKQQNNNERTLVFVAFTAEEMGGFGSQYFSRQLDADKVVAMFNIEMIGTESKWGKNSAYITGYDKTNMGAIMVRDLEGTGFTFHPDPYPALQLFYRSDNATLARLGVPAHTISSSKMDVEPHYHKLTDHVETLDMENMTAIIKAIALSAKSIIAGTATPSRVKVEDPR